MTFIPCTRYFSDDGHEFFVTNRFRNGLVRGFVGLGLEANYKVRVGYAGREWIKAKGHVFEAR